MKYNLVLLFHVVMKLVFKTLLEREKYTSDELEQVAADIIEEGTEILGANKDIYRLQQDRGHKGIFTCGRWAQRSADWANVPSHIDSAT